MQPAVATCLHCILVDDGHLLPLRTVGVESTHVRAQLSSAAHHYKCNYEGELSGALIGQLSFGLKGSR
jgi:hypothetical protein